MEEQKEQFKVLLYYCYTEIKDVYFYKRISLRILFCTQW